jgi:hypothetical protein
MKRRELLGNAGLVTAAVATAGSPRRALAAIKPGNQHEHLASATSVNCNRQHIRFALLVLATLNLVGCSQDSPQRSPAVPSPSSVPTAGPGNSSYVSAMVVDETGLCIEGATVQVVQGQNVGVSVTQTTPCDIWDGDGGVWFNGLLPGVAVTLRTTAPGWAPLDKTVVPPSQVVLTPSRTH